MIESNADMGCLGQLKLVLPCCVALINASWTPRILNYNRISFTWQLAALSHHLDAVIDVTISN